MSDRTTLPDLLADAASARPREAALTVTGGSRLTYREWERRSSVQARGLVRAGIGVGDRVAIRFDAPRWTDYAVAYVAAQRAGAVPVPLAAWWTPVEAARVVRHCEASAVVAPDDLADAEMPVPRLEPLDLEWDGEEGADLPPVDPSATAEILYRSRPLSPPVPHPRSHRALLAAAWTAPAAAGARSLLHAFPPGALPGRGALAAALVPAPLAVVVLPAFDVEHFLSLLASSEVDACALHPVTARALLGGGVAPGVFPQVRTVVVAGRPLPRTLRAGIAEAFPTAALVPVDVIGDDEPGGPAGEDGPGDDDVAPLAPSQEGMVWHEVFAPGSQNLPGLARRYRGPLDVPALRRALDEIVRRHAPLRSTFEVRGGQAVQVVRPHTPLDLPVVDLGGLREDERDATVERRVAEAGAPPFDLVADAPFRPTLLRLAADDHVLVIRAHHAAFDDWSVGVFRRELAALYAAFAQGRPAPLAEPPLQFADFARRQRRALAGAAGERQLAFWRRELEGAPFTSQLAVDDPSLPEGSGQPAGEPVSLTLPRELYEGVRALARNHRATVFMTALAAFGVLVHRYTGQDDLLLATVVANRNRTELEGLIGCFTKKVPLRLRLSGDPTFAEVLSRTRTALLGALANQDLPFEAVIQDVLGAEAASHGLVPHVVLMFQGVTPAQQLTLPHVETTGFETSARATREHFMAGPRRGSGAPASELPWGAGLYLGTFVILSLVESDEELTFVARGAFHAPAVRDLMDRFRTMLADAVTDPSRPISDLALLDAAAEDDALARAAGPREQPSAETLLDALAAQVARRPEAVALRSRAGSLTFAEVGARSDALARSLRAAGAGPRGAVGIALPPSAHAVVAAVAAWKAGAPWLGLEPGDPAAGAESVPDEAALRVVVADGEPRLPPGVRLVRPSGADENDGDGRDGTSGARPLDAAVIHRGAGPAPDGAVVLDERAVLNLAAGLRHDVYGDPEAAGGTRAICLSAGPAHGGFLRQLVALFDGHALRVPDRPDDPAALVALIEAGEVDALDCTPDELRALLEAGLHTALGARPGEDRLTLVVAVRTAPGPELWGALRALPRLRPHVLYGPPESAFGATIAGSGAVRGSGRAMANLEAHVLDARGRPVPGRAAGELHVGGPSLAARCVGAVRDPAARFVELDLGGRRMRLYRTGLLARSLPGGDVELLGPTGPGGDVRGFRVEPDRIRSALTGGGMGAAAVGLERDDDGRARLVATVSGEGGLPGLAAVRAAVWSRVPGYAWPTEVRPLWGHGRAGAAPARSGQEPIARRGRPPEGRAQGPEPLARGGHAEALAAAWADVLGMDEVASGANYWQAFSFLEALATVRGAGVVVPAQAVTRNRTIETLAAAVGRADVPLPFRPPPPVL